MTKITIGQYYPARSIIHRLDARTKLVATMFFIVSIFWVGSWWGYLYALGALGAVVVLSRVPPLFVLRGLRPMLLMLCLMAVLNVFFFPGGEIIFRFLFMSVSREGLLHAGMMATRLMILIAASSVMTLTVTPIQLTDAIESLLKPLKIVKVPVHEIAMMMTIALRFIPTLMDEVDKIMKAQTARGGNFDSGGLLKKARALIPLLVPLFVSAFRRADELAQAMEARCYRGDVNRTKMNVARLAFRDYCAAAIVAIYGVGLLLLR